VLFSVVGAAAAALEFTQKPQYLSKIGRPKPALVIPLDQPGMGLRQG